MKRVKAFSAALLLSVAGLLTLNLAKASAATCVWTGASNDNFNTAANWSGCGGGVPQNGDNISFDRTSLTASKTLNNDITSLSVATVTFSGTNASGYSFKLTGNALTITAGVVANAPAAFDMDVALGADQTWSGSGSYIYLGAFDSTSHTLTMGGFDLTLTVGSLYAYSAMTGNGDLTLDGASVEFNVASPSWTGNLNVTNGSTGTLLDMGALGNAANAVTVSGDSMLNFCGPDGATIQNPITVGGTGDEFGALRSLAGCGFGGGSGANSLADMTLAGTVTLTAATKVYPGGAMKITGPLTGAYTISVIGGAPGSLVIDSSDNTSQTPNGNVSAPAETITIEEGDDQPNTSVSVGTNQTYVIDGVRGTTTVQAGGTLKGTGTVGTLVVYGHVAPGHSPGCLSSGDLDFVESATYDFEVGGTTACSGYDQLKVTGTVTADGTLSVTRYNGFKPAAGQKYVIVDNDGNDAVTGTFKNLAEGATFKVDNYVLKISYKGGSGNDIELSVVSVPATPNTGFALIKSNPLVSAAGMLAAAGGVLLLARRKRPVTARR